MSFVLFFFPYNMYCFLCWEIKNIRFIQHVKYNKKVCNKKGGTCHKNMFCILCKKGKLILSFYCFIAIVFIQCENELPGVFSLDNKSGSIFYFYTFFHVTLNWFSIFTLQIFYCCYLNSDNRNSENQSRSNRHVIVFFSCLSNWTSGLLSFEIIFSLSFAPFRVVSFIFVFVFSWNYLNKCQC